MSVRSPSSGGNRNSGTAQPGRGSEPPDDASTIGLAAALAAVVAAGLAFLAPTLPEPSWTPWLRAVLAPTILIIAAAGAVIVVKVALR